MSNIASIRPRELDPTNMRVGKNVRYIMEERGISQVELALTLGLTESQVSRRIGGKVDWTPADLERAADCLHVSISLLFGLQLPHLDSNQEPIVSMPVASLAAFKAAKAAHTRANPQTSLAR